MATLMSLGTCRGPLMMAYGRERTGDAPGQGITTGLMVMGLGMLRRGIGREGLRSLDVPRDSSRVERRRRACGGLDEA